MATRFSHKRDKAGMIKLVWEWDWVWKSLFAPEAHKLSNSYSNSIRSYAWGTQVQNLLTSGI